MPITITPFEVYVIAILDNVLNGLYTALSVTAIILVCFAFALVISMAERGGKPYRKKILVGTIVTLLFGFMNLTAYSLIPSTKQAAAIVLLPAVVNNEKIQELPEAILDLGIEWIEELKPSEQ